MNKIKIKYKSSLALMNMNIIKIQIKSNLALMNMNIIKIQIKLINIIKIRRKYNI